MTAVWYDDESDSLWIEGAGQTFAPRTLVAVRDGDMIGVRLKDRAANILWQPFGSITDRAKLGFLSAAEAKAYLDGEFAKRRPVGDRLSVAVAIAARGQTVIPLQDPPTILSTLRLVVNGVAYRAPEIAASDVAVTWLNPDFPLDPSDRVTVVYS